MQFAWRRSIETLFTIDDDEDEETAAHAVAHGRFDGITSLLSSDDFSSHLDKYICASGEKSNLSC